MSSRDAQVAEWLESLENAPRVERTALVERLLDTSRQPLSARN